MDTGHISTTGQMGLDFKVRYLKKDLSLQQVINLAIISKNIYNYLSQVITMCQDLCALYL